MVSLIVLEYITDAEVGVLRRLRCNMLSIKDINRLDSFYEAEDRLLA